ncbi:flagellar basal body protein FliL [Fervidicella metallireducens AeB]|uniref:Flagellar protein FliL n=1 Tax=Fervidicella metallireducens AeB TaxID=1403537 RepID=A0A017RWL7_9CLOT|nr:flagellar basal body-associated FliL family protein [Fervidicella metallireducens]EYE88804.1 flagellar basal body protein FliL [Fervidicella metallireducens AeB]
MEAKKSNKLVIILLIVTLTIVVAMAGYFGYFILYKNKQTKTSNNKVTLTEKTVQLDEFVVNLADEDVRYIKVKINLAFTDKKLETEIGEKTPQIRDIINTHLMTKKAEELNSNGMLKLKGELVSKINGLLENGKITNIYLNDIIIQ